MALRHVNDIAVDHNMVNRVQIHCKAFQTYFLKDTRCRLRPIMENLNTVTIGRIHFKRS